MGLYPCKWCGADHTETCMCGWSQWCPDCGRCAGNCEKLREAPLEPLDLSRRSESAERFARELRARIVGQDAAIDAVADLYETFRAGMRAPGRPIANLLLLGPTGTGKTRTVEAMAEVLFGDASAVIKVDCAEFQHSHEIAKLIGSPPGYLGHKETPPILTQETLDGRHTDHCRLSLVLFDEIEKASDALWQMLLGVLDKAILTLGDNRRVDFARAVIFMTSNLGAAEMASLAEARIGFAPPPSSAATARKVERVAAEAARRKFSPEFMNRIDKTIVFRPLVLRDLEAILDIELRYVQNRILAGNPTRQFLFQCTPAARRYLLAEGYDPRCGARHLKRAIERNIVAPIARLLATAQVERGGRVVIDLGPDGKLTFARERKLAAAAVGGLL